MFFLWLKLFYFLRLFEETAAFISMILEMFKDIKVFLLIFFIGVFAFANTYFILDSGDAEPVAGSTYVTAVIYSYLQSLGEFGIDGYDSL